MGAGSDPTARASGAGWDGGGGSGGDAPGGVLLSRRRGALIRAWRDHAGRTSRDLARAAHVSDSALSLLISGARGKVAEGHADLVHAIGEALGADALPGLWRAAGRPEALPPRRLVYLNPSRPGEPAWLWLRVPTQQLHSGPSPATTSAGRPGGSLMDVALQWGILHAQVARRVDGNGLLLLLPTTVANPPLEVRFAGAGGWADLGHGEVPAAVAARLGVPLLTVADLEVDPMRAGPFLPRGDEADEANSRLGGSWLTPLMDWCSRYAASIGVKWALIEPHIKRLWHADVPGALDGQQVESPIHARRAESDGEGLLVSQLLIAGDGLRRVREANGMSRRLLAEAASRLDPSLPTVTARQLELLEDPRRRSRHAAGQLPERSAAAGATAPAVAAATAWRSVSGSGRTPLGPGAYARLDAALRADGRLAVERVVDSRRIPADDNGRSPISFPHWWQGPIWVQAFGPLPDATGTLELVWGPWKRRQLVRSLGVVTTRKASIGGPPLQVRLPPGWWFIAGTGAVPQALDINHRWTPVSRRAAIDVLRQNIGPVRRTTGH